MEQSGERRLIKEWEVSALNRETNEWTTTTNHSYEPVAPNVEELLIKAAKPTIHRLPRSRKPETLTGGSALIGGDAQIPYHDPAMMELFLQIAEDQKPEDSVLVGDMFDLPGFSRFLRNPDEAMRTQESIDYGHEWLSKLRGVNKLGRIALIGGNHEQRSIKAVQEYNAELLGLRRANAAHELAVLSLASLLRLEELDVEYIDGWPNGNKYLFEGEGLVEAFHGTNVAKGGSNAAKYLKENIHSTVYGHTHRQEVAYRTFDTAGGEHTIFAASPGSMSLTDGTVPSFRHTRDAQNNIIKRYEDWQNGVLWLQNEGDVTEVIPARMVIRGLARQITLNGRKYSA